MDPKELPWRLGRVKETSEIADGVKKIVLQTEFASRADPGAHVDVMIDEGTVRSYSIVECSAGGRLLTIAVRLSPHSRGGSAFMHDLVEDSEIRVTEPLQDFPVRVGARFYVLVAGGIGITALMAMGETLQRHGADYTFAYVGRRREEMAFLPELTALHGDRLHLHVTEDGNPLDVDALIAVVAGAEAAKETELYMCGPIPLMNAVRHAWNRAALPPTNLRYETFGNSGSFLPEEFVVRVPRHNIDIAVGANESILEALERVGIEIMSDCRRGACGLCRLKVIDVDGQIDHRDVFLSENQKEASSHLCACVSRLISGLSPLNIGVLTLDIP